MRGSTLGKSWRATNDPIGFADDVLGILGTYKKVPPMKKEQLLVLQG